MISLPKNKPLMWRLCWTIAAGTVLLFWAVDVLTKRTEHRMSYIAEEYQQELLNMGQTAESILVNDGEQALARWLQALQEEEQTWAAVVSSQVIPLANGYLSDQFKEGFRLGRSVEWKIHLYFKENPIMDITFEGGEFSERNLHFLIQLPQRMRPGAYLQYTHLLLQIALPLILLTAVALVLYRHVMLPLQQLERATRQFSKGNYEVRVKSFLGTRNDELSALAETFDAMTAKIGSLILTQRQLIADLSHELRTPLARIDMAVDCIEHGIKTEESMQRLKKESITMRQLVEDTLTLAWLENEKPRLNEEEVDLIELLELLVEDAQFEYPDRRIDIHFPESIILPSSSHRALAQALENIIRNALKYTPAGGVVTVQVASDQDAVTVEIQDQGPGVPEQYCEDIFQPFFRVEKSRSEQQMHDPSAEKPGGFGLGLALARRQIEAVGGSIEAGNVPEGGLMMRIQLPR
ncbi:sensor histidine kinase [Litoribrevibacter albus]|uniref:histidine kinase n=1 Tax=Litoribrevibacter albus TaxID=1473156 RepID=A0AA37SD87_9GAMM|nr:sensor histidine kinase [Litoribrevibacter albus]GLQ32858.1 sensor protein PfeS [Litoribrevibacter albus]